MIVTYCMAYPFCDCESCAVLEIAEEREQLINDVKLLRQAAKSYCYCSLIPRYKNKLNPNEKCVSCEALAATDKPEYKDD